jgi:hypothetical protein
MGVVRARRDLADPPAATEGPEVAVGVVEFRADGLDRRHHGGEVVENVRRHSS